MGRPERPLDPDSGPLAAFASDLRQLRRQAGPGTYRDMAKRAHFSPTALSEAAGGRSLPTLEVTLAFVRACDGDAGQWRQRWHQVNDRLQPVAARTVPSGSPAGPGTPGARELESPDRRPGGSGSPARRMVAAAALVVVVAVVAVVAGGWLASEQEEGQPQAKGQPQADGQPPEQSELVPLRRLWKEASADNLLTTEGRWSTEPRMTTSDGFKVHGVEGYIHTFRTPAPSCMTALVRFERVTEDGGVEHATTGDPAWTAPGGAPPPDYERRATQGYVYHPDAPPPPGTKPLYRLYNERRGDYFTTTDPAWAGPVGTVVQRGYVVQRLEGYVLADRVAPPPRC